MSSWFFSLVFGAIGGFGGGYAAWRIKRQMDALKVVVRKVVVDTGAACSGACTALEASKQLATDIDSVDERFDSIYAVLERHEKTFAKSRRSRVAKKATTAPKFSDANGVNDGYSADKSVTS